MCPLSKIIDISCHAVQLYYFTMATIPQGTLGTLIRHMREERQISAKDLASQLLIAPSTLSKIEADQRSLSREALARLAALFGVSEQELRVLQMADKLAYDLLGQNDISDRVLQVTEEKLKYLRQQHTVQGTIDF